MKIGPVDIRNHTFTKRMRGLNESEVRDYLDLVADRLEEVILEADDLRGKIGQLETEVRDFRSLERMMRDSLLSAERLVDERTAQAEKEAQIVIKNAEIQAEKMLGRTREDMGRLRADLDDLRRQRITYVERFRALLRSQTKILEASVEGLDPEDGRSAPPSPGRSVSAEIPVTQVTPRSAYAAEGADPHGGQG